MFFGVLELLKDVLKDVFSKGACDCCK